MVICIFGNTVVTPGMEEAETKLTDKLAAILSKMPGFISSKSSRGGRWRGDRADRFDSRESLDAWAHEGTHKEAQNVAADYYESFWVHVETYREYTWESGNHVDGDLTYLFREAPRSPTVIVVRAHVAADSAGGPAAPRTLTAGRMPGSAAGSPSRAGSWCAK